MLAELDGEAVKRAGMQAGQEAFDNKLGAQVEPGNLANNFRSKIFFRGGHGFPFTTKTQRTQNEAETFLPLPSSLCTLCLCRESLLPLLIFRRFGFADGGQQLLDDVLAGLPFSLSLEVGADAMAKNRDGHFL